MAKIFFLVFPVYLLICLGFLTVSIFPDSGHFNVDNIRVCKILVSLEMYQCYLDRSFFFLCQKKSVNLNFTPSVLDT